MRHTVAPPSAVLPSVVVVVAVVAAVAGKLRWVAAPLEAADRSGAGH